MAPCRTPTMANDPGGGGRTYSGVCSTGQAIGQSGSPGKLAASLGCTDVTNIHRISMVCGLDLRFGSN